MSVVGGADVALPRGQTAAGVDSSTRVRCRADPGGDDE